MAEEKRGRGRPAGSTKASGYKTPGTAPTGATREAPIRDVMERIIDTPEYLGEFFALLLAPENRKRLTEWGQQQRMAVDAVDALLTGRSHREDLPHGRGVGA
jgi:hypothetical protein